MNTQSSSVARLWEHLAVSRIVAVIAPSRAGGAEGLAHTLLAAGVTTVEVVMRHESACGLIAQLSASDLVVGAGTVLTRADADSARSAGADFLVSPGLDLDLLTYAMGTETPFIPGVSTPTEILRARNMGVMLQKLFPIARLGGPAWIRDVAAPFADVEFMPSGGIDARLAGELLAEPSVIAVGCSWIASDTPDGFDLAAVDEAARTAVRIAGSAS